MESPTESIMKIGGAIDVLDANIHHYLWRGKGAEYANLKVGYYNKLGANLPVNVERGLSPQIKEPPPPPPPLAIVLCAYNGLVATKHCLLSVAKNTGTNYSLHLVDNGSRDGTLEHMRGVLGHEPIVLVRNEGVAKGRNLGASQALTKGAKYLCFLDNDTRVPPGWAQGMIDVLEANPNIGMIGPVSGTASGAQNVLEVYRTKNCDEAYMLARGHEQSFTPVSEIDRFCMVVRADVVKKIGLFEEGFGLYGFEEKDFCKRVKIAGYDVAIANRVFVEHRGGTTMAVNKIDWHAVIMASRSRYKQKWSEDPALKTYDLPPAATKNIVARAPMGRITSRTSIIILTHNRLDITKECLEALLRYTQNYELIVVDNGSTDGTVQYLESKGKIKIIRNEENLGVIKARNQGLRASTADHIVMMDNDVFVREGWLEELFDAMDRQGADMVGIEAWQIDSNFAACYKCVSQNDRFDYLGGCCTLFKRRVFEDVGILDEGFHPAYYEDVDMSLRARDQGLKLAWHTTTKIFHKEHQTLVYGQKTFAYQEVLSNSYDRFAKKRRGQITVQHEKLPPKFRKLRILYLAMEHDYGVPERGPSFEHCNFYPSFKNWERMQEIRHFDFLALAKEHGVPKMSDMLLDTVNKFCPDVVFGVFFDQQNDPRREVLRRIGDSTPATTIGWFCDSHWRYESFDRPWAEHLDFCVTTSKSGYEKYLADGFAKKAIKSQWAASPTYKNLNMPPDIDVSFVGQPHGDRRQVIEALASAGINVQVFGTGWGRRLEFDEMIGVFNRSKINLNLSNALDATLKQIKGRNFEVPGCGGFLLTGNAENLSDYYVPDKEIVLFESTQEMADKIKHFLMHEGERRAIAEQGYQRTMREHTYAQRFDCIFSRAGLL
jgi:spore maturation protein CgeB